MSLIWTFYWPVLLAATVVGILAGRSGFYQRKVPDDASGPMLAEAARAYRFRKRKAIAVGGIALVLILLLWHWPLGAGNRFADSVERSAQEELQRVETPEVTARLARSPLSRTLVMSGTANEFQKDGYVRLMKVLPGVARVTWQGEGRGFDLPLIAEVALLSLLTFAAGLFFSYVVELRRRVNAYWNW